MNSIKIETRQDAIKLLNELIRGKIAKPEEILAALQNLREAVEHHTF